MLKKKFLIKNWNCLITQKGREVIIIFTKDSKEVTVKEYMEIAGFGIEDYSERYLEYLLDTQLGIVNNKKKYKPVVYH